MVDVSVPHCKIYEFNSAKKEGSSEPDALCKECEENYYLKY